MEQDATQVQIDTLVKNFEKFLQISIERKNFNPIEMQTFMKPWFTKFGYRQVVSNTESDKSETSILILQDSPAIGDFIVTSSAIREIRRIYQDAYITLLISKSMVSLAENCPYANEILAVNRPYDGYDFKSIYMWNLSMAHEILHRRYDIAFAFSFGEASSTILLAYMAGAKERISNPNGWNLQFTPLLTAPAQHCLHGSHAIDDCISCVDYLLRAPVSHRQSEIWYDSKDIHFAKELLKRYAITYAVCIGGSQRKKHYSPIYYASLINRIAEYEDVQFVILGGQNDIQEAEIIKNHVSKNNIRNLTGKLSLCQTAAVLSFCKYCISNDTATTHMAAALNIPVLMPSCFPSDIELPFISCLERWYPYGVPSVIVQPTKALPECKKSQNFLGCQSDSPHCINQIKPEVMFRAFRILKQQTEKKICKPLLLNTTE